MSSHAYGRFLEEQDPLYLGVAMEDTTWLAKLMFSWAEPLMKKGVEKKLNHPDDLYDLPESLNCSVLATRLNKALLENSGKYDRKGKLCHLLTC